MEVNFTPRVEGKFIIAKIIIFQHVLKINRDCRLGLKKQALFHNNLPVKNSPHSCQFSACPVNRFGWLFCNA